MRKHKLQTGSAVRVQQEEGASHSRNRFTTNLATDPLRRLEST
jgi:hypothetical protein